MDGEAEVEVAVGVEVEATIERLLGVRGVEGTDIVAFAAADSFSSIACCKKSIAA